MKIKPKTKSRHHGQPVSTTLC